MSEGISKKREIPVATVYRLPKVELVSLAPKQGGCERFRGVDFVTTLSSATTAVTGTWQRIYVLNSTLFPRLSQEAALFERWKFHKLRIWIYGKSSSTAPGTITMTSAVNDGFGGSLAATTESQIKNLGSPCEVRGQDASFHEVDCAASGLKWLVTDTDALAAVTGSQLGLAIYYIDPTAVAGDLKYSVYVEYDIEFDIRTAANSNNFARRMELIRNSRPWDSEQEQNEEPVRENPGLETQLQTLQRRLKDFEQKRSGPVV